MRLVPNSRLGGPIFVGTGSEAGSNAAERRRLPGPASPSLPGSAFDPRDGTGKGELFAMASPCHIPLAASSASSGLRAPWRHPGPRRDFRASDPSYRLALSSSRKQAIPANMPSISFSAVHR